jgi:ribosome assembly protein 4
LSWSRDSKWIVSGSKDATIKIWNVKNKKLAYDLPGHADEVFGVDWSPNGVQMASGGKDKMVRIWKN